MANHCGSPHHGEPLDSGQRLHWLPDSGRQTGSPCGILPKGPQRGERSQGRESRESSAAPEEQCPSPGHGSMAGCPPTIPLSPRPPLTDVFALLSLLFLSTPRGIRSSRGLRGMPVPLRHKPVAQQVPELSHFPAGVPGGPEHPHPRHGASRGSPKQPGERCRHSRSRRRDDSTLRGWAVGSLPSSPLASSDPQPPADANVGCFLPRSALHTRAAPCQRSGLGRPPPSCISAGMDTPLPPNSVSKELSHVLPAPCPATGTPHQHGQTLPTWARGRCSPYLLARLSQRVRELVPSPALCHRH
ncbi:uncharacterized protein LOC134522303 isoform X2 [Chroicocephalus ridibundus]|uniref:uncharacterized protein LOC134522303 isoform X2 n=1 Tax=Chroicocephalus ridibundus TaxID=1192867 RepID=UPI002FDE095E